MAYKRDFQDKKMIPSSPLYGWSASLPKKQRRETLDLASKRFGRQNVINRLKILEDNWRLVGVKRKASEDIAYLRRS